MESSGLDSQDILEARAPFSRTNKMLVRFKSSQAATWWLARWRTYRDDHPCTWCASALRGQSPSELYVARQPSFHAKQRSSVSWRCKEALVKILGPALASNVELVWGRHIIYYDNCRLRLGALDRKTGRYVWDAGVLSANFGAQVKNDLLRATADVVALQEPDL